MPLYSYECADCGGAKDELRKLPERNNLPDCDLCKKPMQRVIGGHSVIGDMAPYYDDNLETYVTSRQHRKEVMREKGVYESFGKNWHTGASAKRRA